MNTWAQVFHPALLFWQRSAGKFHGLGGHGNEHINSFPIRFLFTIPHPDPQPPLPATRNPFFTLQHSLGYNLRAEDHHGHTRVCTIGQTPLPIMWLSTNDSIQPSLGSWGSTVFAVGSCREPPAFVAAFALPDALAVEETMVSFFVHFRCCSSFLLLLLCSKPGVLLWLLFTGNGSRGSRNFLFISG